MLGFLLTSPLGGVKFFNVNYPLAKAEGFPSSKNMKYKVENGTLTITGCDLKPTGDLIIPDTIDGFPVTSIGDFAFFDCAGLTSVTIPNELKNIGTDAFPVETNIIRI